MWHREKQWNRCTSFERRYKTAYFFMLALFSAQIVHVNFIILKKWPMFDWINTFNLYNYWICLKRMWSLAMMMKFFEWMYRFIIFFSFSITSFISYFVIHIGTIIASSYVFLFYMMNIIYILVRMNSSIVHSWMKFTNYELKGATIGLKPQIFVFFFFDNFINNRNYDKFYHITLIFNYSRLTQYIACGKCHNESHFLICKPNGNMSVVLDSNLSPNK